MNFGKLKEAVFGKPIASKHAHQERLPKRVALPVFASDALSSTAYATEEIMRTFLHVSPKFMAGGISMSLGYAFLSQTFNIAILICILIVIVSLSYSQTIKAYPGGGGSYTVAKENLGTWPGRLAGASLLIDYILTVAVSVSAGVLALISFNTQLQPYVLHLNCFFILLITIANLRGAKESGALFSIPTYTFVLLFGTLIVYGTFFAAGHPAPPEVALATEELKRVAPNPTELIGWAWILIGFKAFSSGCTALTGIEAISNGTQAFKEPVSRNAAITLWWMAGILSFLFVGGSYLAEKFHIIPMEFGEPGFKTVVAMITQATFPQNTSFGVGYFTAMQFATAGILILAANTAYADFPRLASIIARDNYLPRQLAVVGDRLVYQNGIIILAVTSCLLIVKFGGDTSKLIPLYAIGVFASFTLSQFGMVVHQRKDKKSLATQAVSFFGGTITLIITVVIAVSKWTAGAWVVFIAVPLVLSMMLAIQRHYRYLARELEITPEDKVLPARTVTLLLVPRVHRGILNAISYARALSEDVRALHVTIDPKTVAKVKEDWVKHGQEMPLVILESPYRSLVGPIIDYVEQTLSEDPEVFVTVIVPESVPRRLWHRLLHTNAAIPLKAALGARKRVVITNVRHYLK